ncbi:MAG: DUF4959 domain-containing protein [Prevotella sp.]|nr:DUF4959 domain-containing protein [Prevotella sp.]
MNKIIKLFLAGSVCCCMTAALTACSDDDDTALTAVTNLSYEPTMGGAIITYQAPESNDLLYIKASYTNSLGKKVSHAASIYDNKIEVDGLADETKTYPIAVSAVDKWGGETAATIINVQPGRSYINIVKDNLTINPMPGGFTVLWENPAGADVDNADEIDDKTVGKPVYVVVTYTDAEGVTRTRYLVSKMKNAKNRVRGLFEGSYNVTYRVEDAQGNKTVQSASTAYSVPPEAEFRKFNEREDPKNGTIKEYIWTIVAKLTTLQPAWDDNVNAAIFDGIIDSKAGGYHGYAGTDASHSSVTYGAALPWDTEQMDIVVDMHQVVSISRLKAWQRAYHYGDQPYSGANQTNGESDDYDYYQPTNLKHFKLFGAMTLDDDAWFLIKDCDIATNTTAGALPQYWTNPEYLGKTNVYMPTNESYQAALDGHEWELDEMTDSVRYLRVRMVENWDLSKRQVSGLSELNLYGAVLVGPEELAAQEAAATSRKH